MSISEVPLAQSRLMVFGHHEDSRPDEQIARVASQFGFWANRFPELDEVAYTHFSDVKLALFLPGHIKSNDTSWRLFSKAAKEAQVPIGLMAVNALTKPEGWSLSVQEIDPTTIADRPQQPYSLWLAGHCLVSREVGASQDQLAQTGVTAPGTLYGIDGGKAAQA